MKMHLFLLGVPLCLVAAGSVADRARITAPKEARLLSLERAAEDGGGSLPEDDQGRSVVAEGVPFTLALQVPAHAQRITLTADRDLGDPARGGVKAGEDLSFLAVSQNERGARRLTIEFEAGSDLLPGPGEIAFTVGIGGWHGVQPQMQQTAHLVVHTITSLRVHVMPIFSTYCWGCHGASTKFEGLELTLTGVFSTAVDMRAHETPNGSCAELRMARFDPDASYLVHKIQGTHLGGCVMGGGDRMPVGGPYLSNTQIDVIRTWILQGCRNN